MTKHIDSAMKRLLGKKSYRKGKFEIGDVVRNKSSGCNFVVEEDDLDLIKSNIGNYELINSNYRGKPESYNGYKSGGDITFRKKQFGFIPHKITYRILRNPSSGEFALTSKAPYCLSCNRPEGLLRDYLNKYDLASR